MGINRAYDLSQLSKEDFQPIAAGHTVDAEFDISETFDLTPGEYAISSEGSLPFSNPDCTGISGVIPYKSNEITVKVTEPSIAGVSKGTVNRRGAVDDTTCTKDQKAAVDTAVKRASSLSKAAADAAVNGDARLFEYYFRTTDSATRQEVAARFAAIANETSSVDGGKATYNCGNDVKQSDCGKGVLAYAVSGKNMVVTCPDWYKILPETDDCGGKDKGLTMLHEISHLGAVYNPPTTDMAYGYDSIISLSKEDAIRNADTYNYYAAGEIC